MYVEDMSLTFEMDDIPAEDEKAEDCQTWVLNIGSFEMSNNRTIYLFIAQSNVIKFQSHTRFITYIIPNNCNLLHYSHALW
jgi:hypothetical protein